MLEDKSALIREYVTALRNKTAAVFMGAGMSYDIFKKNWKELIAPYAQAVDLDMGQSPNYLLVAQAYANQNSSEALKTSVASQFYSKDTTDVHRIFARLPIQEYWTTNYDKLIENALDELLGHYDTVYDNDSFSVIDDDRERMVYKCHGDCAHPTSIVITQDDYEEFSLTRFNFSTALLKALATNTFLFVGYSLNDPDINNLLAKIKIINKKRTAHYLITKEEKEPHKAKEQLLWIENLERYGIKTLLIDDYPRVQEIVEEIEKQYMANKILISGSAETYDEFSNEKSAQDFIYKLGYRLVQFDSSSSNKGHGMNIINGNGKGVGPYLYEGVAEAAATYGLDMADYLLMYPFPKSYYEKFEKEKSIEERYYAYRQKMISKCGVVFFLFGNRYNDEGKIVNAPGVRKEFDIAVANGKFVFPIGCTGYMAKELATEVLENFEKYNGDMPKLKKILERLNAPGCTTEEIISGVESIIDALAFRVDAR